MKLASLLILLLGLLGLAYAPRPPRAAAAGACGGSCKLYLPFMSVAPPIPHLSAPSNGAQLDTIAPILTWTPQITGTYQIQAATDASFATPAISATTILPNLQPAQHILDGNLSPTTTYYWRVGVFFQGSQRYSPTWRFTTSAKNYAILPPHPRLLAPSNGALLPAREATVSWAATPNALYYRVKIYNPGGTLFDSAIIAAPTTSYHVAGLAAGTAYTWSAKALNQYGWGTYPSAWSFRTP